MSENVFQLTEQGQYWADFGLLAEFAYSLEHGGANAIELGLLGQKDWGRNEFRLNVLVEQELESGADTEMEYRWQYRYRLDERFEPGIEMYGGAGEWGDLGDFGEHESNSALQSSARCARRTARSGTSSDCCSASPTRRRDTTVRFMIEYEF